MADVVRIWQKPASVRGRSLTDHEERAMRGAALHRDEEADLIKAGWSFTEYMPVGASVASEDGPMVAAVKADLAHIDTSTGAKRSMSALALWLAQVIDRRGSEGGASTAARLGQELRATMQALTAEGSGGDPALAKALMERLSTPDAS